MKPTPRSAVRRALLQGAVALAATLPFGAPALAHFEQHAASAFRRYTLLARTLLLLSHAPALRRPVVSFLAAHPQLFSLLLGCFLHAPARRQPRLDGHPLLALRR